MGEKFDRVKQHVKDNWKTYVVGGVCLVIGGLAVGVAMSNRDDEDEENRVTLDIRPTVEIENSTFTDSPLNIDMVNNIAVSMVERSTPSNVVMNADGTKVWASQGEAARDLGINPALLSNHLNGRVPHINGEHYVRVPKIGSKADVETAA